MSGGAGYVLSARALNDVFNKGFRQNACAYDGGDEDVEMGKCLAVKGLLPIISILSHRTSKP